VAQRRLEAVLSEQSIDRQQLQNFASQISRSRDSEERLLLQNKELR
jgi:hypothetical protein